MMQPRPYQIIGRDFLAARTCALLADEMRVGKTPQAILAAETVGAERVTVVCPAIAVPHWQAEWRKWWSKAPLYHLRIMSYNKATAIWEAGHVQKSDVFIVDETHFAKNAEAKRTQAVYGKTGFAWHSERCWALSGTPATKHAGELWPMMRAFGATALSHVEFHRRYCTWNAWKMQYDGTRADMIPELKTMLGRIMLRRTRRDVAPDMPAIDFQFLEVEPTNAATLRIPHAMEDLQLIDWLEAHPSADRESRIEVAIAKVLPLIEEIKEATADGRLRQTVVFGWHREPLKAMLSGLEKYGISAALLVGETGATTRSAIQKEFQRGELQVVVANILAAGTAIDLSAASHGYFLELDWVPGNNAQAANRLVSLLKADPVTFDVVTWPGSIDDRVQRVLLRRAQELCNLY